MGNDAARTLSDQISGSLPAGIAALGPDDQQILADALRDARRRQAADLSEATEAGLKFVPALLRGTVRKAVGL